jgi:hypothetical protein
MAWRTNKQRIAKKKAQQAKQASRMKWAKRFDYPKRSLDLKTWMEIWAIHEVTNPAWNTWHWFFRWRKVCFETRLRTDPDWYRYIRTPNWWMNVVSAPQTWYVRRKMSKRRNLW